MNGSYLCTPRLELDRRIVNFQQQLKHRGISCALILQKADLFYFSGTVQQAHLFIPHEGKPLLMVFRDLERAMAESFLTNIVSLSSPKKIPALIKAHGHYPGSEMGMELDVLPVNLFSMYDEIFKSMNIVDISHEIRVVRSVKSDYELDIIRKAATLSDQLAEKAGELVKEGMTEIELAGEIEAVARKLGHQGLVRMRLWGNELFYGHLMCGPSGAIASYMSSPTGGRGVNPSVAQGPGYNIVKKNEPLLIDYVFVLNGYMSDHARIFSIGEIPDELLKAHDAMLDVQDLVKREAKPGVLAGTLYELAMERCQELGYGKNFMGVGDRRVRFVGHGVGLELDEYPFFARGQKLPLSKGMVVAIEPKLVFPDKGVVGVENTCVVTETGLECLSCFEEKVTVV